MSDPRVGRSSPIAAVLLGAVLLLGAVGCSSGSRVSDEDRRIIAELGPIAARDADIDVEPGDVECWLPSANAIDEARFRVLCRVHYEQAGAGRYRDMICIGEARREPVADYCYQWAPYSDMPAFEDRPAFAAS